MKLHYSGEVNEHGPEFAQKLKRYLLTSQQDWQHQLIPNLDYIDPRALNDNGITITDVVYVCEVRYSLEYQYDWFVFSGCTDTDLTGTDSNKVVFTCSNTGDLEFDLSALGL